jgi:hypothetical protein
MLSFYHLPVLMLALSCGMMIIGMGGISNVDWVKKVDRRYGMPIRIVYDTPWVNANNLAVMTLVAGIIGYVSLRGMTNNHIIGIIGFLAGTALPVLSVEMVIQKIIADQEASLSLMFGMLKRWASIHPDLIQCLSRVSEEPLTPALKLALKRLLQSVQHGVEIEKAFDDFSLALDIPLFRDFMIHLKFSARNRGDLVKLFDSFERESYRLFLERNKNRLENRKFKMTIFLLDGTGLALFLMMISEQPHVRRFYLESTAGLNVTAGLSGMILLTICLAIFSGSKRGTSR